jgi:hypothetical protein
MLRRFLAGLLMLLVVLGVAAKVRVGWRSRAGTSRPGPVTVAPRDLTLTPGKSDRSQQLASEPFGALVVLPDSLTRAGARVRLGAEVERHYLDSLFIGADSTVRRWPVGSEAIGLVIVPGGPAGFVPEMVSEVRQALDAWSPATVGLRFLEQADTVDVKMIVRWTDTLAADRAGATDVTWDKSGRVHRVTVYLAVRSPSTGRPFAPEARRAIVLHELGHALGLPHSAHPEDAMYPIATATGLTDRDRFSLRLLYELPTGWIGTTIRSRLQ